MSRGYISGALMDVDQLVNVVEAVVRTDSSVSMPSITVTPRPAGRGAPTIEEAAAASGSEAAVASASAAAIAGANADRDGSR